MTELKAVTKEDYEKAREMWAARVINIEGELEAAKGGLAFVVRKIKEFPEGDPMPKETKELLEGVTK